MAALLFNHGVPQSLHGLTLFMEPSVLLFDIDVPRGLHGVTLFIEPSVLCRFSLIN